MIKPLEEQLYLILEILGFRCTPHYIARICGAIARSDFPSKVLELSKLEPDTPIDLIVQKVLLKGFTVEELQQEKNK